MLIAVFKAPLEIVGRRPRGSVRHILFVCVIRNLIATRSLRETRRHVFASLTMGACLSSPPKTEPSNERSSEDEEKDSEDEEKDFNLYD